MDRHRRVGPDDTPVAPVDHAAPAAVDSPDDTPEPTPPAADAPDETPSPAQPAGDDAGPADTPPDEDDTPPDEDDTPPDESADDTPPGPDGSSADDTPPGTAEDSVPDEDGVPDEDDEAAEDAVPDEDGDTDKTTAKGGPAPVPNPAWVAPWTLPGAFEHASATDGVLEAFEAGLSLEAYVDEATRKAREEAAARQRDDEAAGEEPPGPPGHRAPETIDEAAPAGEATTSREAPPGAEEAPATTGSPGDDDVPPPPGDDTSHPVAFAPQAVPPEADRTSAPVAPARRVPSFAGPLALELVHLHKSFGPKHAVDDLSLNVPPGVLFGLVGPNGAGKTTTLSMAAGLLRPDAGGVSVWGRDVWADPPAAKALMGVLPEGLRLFDRLTGAETLRMVGELRGMKRAEIAARSASLLAALDLAADANTPIADYSAGMAKKIALACALIHDPRLLLLDEPFESVDPASVQAVNRILDQFVDAGGTVVLSSHVMDLVESLCDAVAVIADGHLLAAGPVDEVCAGEPLQQRFLALVGAHDLAKGALPWLGSSSASS